MGWWWLTAIGALVTGLCYGIQKYLQWTGYRLPSRLAYYNDGVAYYFKTLLLLLFVRSFIVEWTIIPSDSLKPTLLVGDRILTDKLVYGVRLPITGHLLLPLDQPKRGDIVAFRSPIDPSHSLVQRLIGLPGDTIQYRDKQLTVNGKPIPQVEIGLVQDQEEEHLPSWILCQENLDGRVYQMYRTPHSKFRLEKSRSTSECTQITVPPGHYFVMGDHRDRSIDSRAWGCLPDRYLLGKATRIYLSRNQLRVWWKPHTLMRWTRIGMKVR